MTALAENAAAETAADRGDDAAPPAFTIHLADNLDRAAAAPLLASLLEERGQDLTLDASSVQRIGGQCLQVLMSAAATWKADQAVFAVIGASPEFTSIVESFGVDPERLLPRAEIGGATL